MTKTMRQALYLLVLFACGIRRYVVEANPCPSCYYQYNPDLHNFSSISTPLQPPHVGGKFKWESNEGLDVLVLFHAFKDKPAGYYVDFGAGEYKGDSPTYVMDTFNHWGGVCVEGGGRARLEELVGHRGCAVFDGSNLSAGRTDIGANSTAATILHPCLPDMLAFSHAPHEVDYLSIRVIDPPPAPVAPLPPLPSVAQTLALTLPHYKFLVVTILQPSQPTHALLSQHDYAFTFAYPSGTAVYFHKSHPDFYSLFISFRNFRQRPAWGGVERTYLLHPHVHLFRMKTYSELGQCSHVETSPLTDQDFSRMHLWSSFHPRHPNGTMQRRQGDTLYGFETLIREVHQHQHPSREECARAQFAIAPGWGFGFGSDTHRLGLHLAIAMNLGRILLRDPIGYNLAPYVYETPFCANQTNGAAHKSHECYYEPLSSCTIDDIFPGFYSHNASMQRYFTDSLVTFDGWNDVPLEDLLSGNFSDPMLQNRIIKLPNFGHNARFETPLEYQELLECSFEAEAKRPGVVVRGAHSAAVGKLWGAVSAAFILRPHTATLRELDRLRGTSAVVSLLRQGEEMGAGVGGVGAGGSGGGGSVASSSSRRRRSNSSNFTCAVGMHVRHGDKYTEMRLVRTQTYLDVAVGLVEGHMANPRPTGGSSGEGMLKQSIFFSTETPTTLHEAVNWTREHGWDLQYTDMFDRGTVGASSLTPVGNEHNEDEYISMLLNLDLILRCTAWVSTMRSNTCVVQNELRATVAMRADSVNIALN